MTPAERIAVIDYVRERFDHLEDRVDGLEDRLPGIVYWKDLAMAITTGAAVLGVLATVIL